ncbi:MAG: methylmalonate-semialdehyde dehydrogenase, partial [Proteobacteria bacterium]|nr:methylmalonate-semialdehyde dehydrogenase [Pseudomonadota bacterium]
MNKPIEPAAGTVPLWIGGKPVVGAGTRTGPVYNPATGEVTRHVAFASAADVDAAVAAAQAALPDWRDAPPLRRARVMQRFLALLQENQRALAQIITAEH